MINPRFKTHNTGALKPMIDSAPSYIYYAFSLRYFFFKGHLLVRQLVHKKQGVNNCSLYQL
jgi:hypothetical protein